MALLHTIAYKDGTDIHGSLALRIMVINCMLAQLHVCNKKTMIMRTIGHTSHVQIIVPE